VTTVPEIVEVTWACATCSDADADAACGTVIAKRIVSAAKMRPRSRRVLCILLLIIKGERNSALGDAPALRAATTRTSKKERAGHFLDVKGRR
jgi:hypothetical protein